MDTAVADAKVQHVTKKSSDELLRKFAELGSDIGDNAQKKKKKRSRWEDGVCQCESPSHHVGTAFVERRSLLPLAATRRTALLQQLGIGKTRQRASRDIRNKSLLGTIEKTWRRTAEGASRVFMKRHYQRHKRLISDIA